MNFSSYHIQPSLLSALEKERYIEMTPIQEKSLPLALKGVSLLCKSATGSGKTHAFLIPLIETLDQNYSGIQKVILVPTAELVYQCANFLKNLKKHLDTFQVIALTTAEDRNFSLKNLKNAKEPTIVVSTPGRAKDLFLSEKRDFSMQVSTLVLDEADMLLESSYFEDVQVIYTLLHPRQVLVYTATMKEHEINRFAKYLKIPKIIECDDPFNTKNVVHQWIDIRHLDKKEALYRYLMEVKPYFAVVFMSSKKEIEKLDDFLNEKGVSTLLLSGNLDTRKRNAILKKLSYGEHPLLLASDVASRGIDFQDVSHVLSLDLPKDLDYYFHRAGRTGRNSKKGISVIFKDKDSIEMEKLQKKIHFQTFILKEDGLKEIKERKKPTKKRNENLQKEIHHQIRKIKSKTKTAQKKRIRVAIIKAEKAHKKKIIRENLKAKRNSSR